MCMVETKKVAFLGMGVMGFPMAGHLAAKGYDVVVYNRPAGKAESWVAKHGGSFALTPRAAARDRHIVLGKRDLVRMPVNGGAYVDGKHTFDRIVPLEPPDQGAANVARICRPGDAH